MMDCFDGADETNCRRIADSEFGMYLVYSDVTPRIIFNNLHCFMPVDLLYPYQLKTLQNSQGCNVYLRHI